MSEEIHEVKRRGSIAVIARDGRMLVIRRSRFVIAPRTLCFPGGGIQGDESEEEALVRELQEELGVTVRPVRRIWENVTPWNVHLAWWVCHLDPGATPVPNPAEVESVGWYTPNEIANHPELLSSNHPFFRALEAGEIDLVV